MSGKNFALLCLTYIRRFYPCVFQWLHISIPSCTLSIFSSYLLLSVPSPLSIFSSQHLLLSASSPLSIFSSQHLLLSVSSPTATAHRKACSHQQELLFPEDGAWNHSFLRTASKHYKVRMLVAVKCGASHFWFALGFCRRVFVRNFAKKKTSSISI